jgi:hypothetical protein
VDDYDRALREAIQLVALLGLWRGRFFEHAAFYGGTALRVVHGLPRFSEDIDFSLLETDRDFSLQPYFDFVSRELEAFGFTCTVQGRDRTTGGAIESAFLKANTKTHILEIAPSSGLAEQLPSNQLLKVKLEVDTDPPGGFSTEANAVIDPVPFHVRTYALPDLFAGKMHSVLCRRWKSRVKGRDWYDLIWFLQRGTPLHLAHLEARMRQSEDWTKAEPLDLASFRQVYEETVMQTDFSRAAQDVLPFIADARELDAWGQDLFLSLSERFRAV